MKVTQRMSVSDVYHGLMKLSKFGRRVIYINYINLQLTLSTLKTSLPVCTNSVDPDEPARNKPSHQDLHRLQVILSFCNRNTHFIDNGLFQKSFTDELIHVGRKLKVEYSIKLLRGERDKTHLQVHFAICTCKL